ncbi:thioredoxin family protein [Priestia megaterium]|uniref:thioredoxin family protein n=1 Tax=Priestia megaterium TaxID=1404 RepID=UPI00077D7E04|nr:thioredoxin family protein [Priestia megaterium]
MKKYILSFSVILVVLGISIYVYNSSVKNEHEYKDISFNQYEKKIKTEDSFFLYVYRTGCPACGELDPTLNKTIKDKQLKVYSIEMSKNRNLHKEYFIENNIVSTPMLIHYTKGKEDSRLSEEFITKKKLDKFFSENQNI